MGFPSPPSPLADSGSSLGRVRTPTVGDTYQTDKKAERGNGVSAKKKEPEMSN